VYTKDWWEKNWAEKFEQNLDDDALEALEIEFDKAVEYHIVGVTAVEDKLQDQVPETIENLLSAGIRTWILTGDKKETAINIGYACNLLTPDMKDNNLIHDIDHINFEEQFNKHGKDGNLMVNSGKDAKHGMVITGQAIDAIFQCDKEMQDSFVRFALNCHSIVACRLQPSQKARIVLAIKEGTGCITLAIGDGANDEAMIRVANIGVGIAGLEGTTAARASDYAISQFRMLNNLLFVHGRNCYRGTSYLVFYAFYKNLIHIFSFFSFAFYSGFSAQPLYLEWAWQMWNTFFTAFPIFVFNLADRDISEDILLSHPETYSITNGNDSKPPLKLAPVIESKFWRFIKESIDLDAGAQFNSWSFRNWVFECLLQAIFVLNTFAYSYSRSTSFSADGKTWGLQEAALGVFTTYFLVMTLILCFKYSHWTFYHTFVIGITVIGYFCWLLFINVGANGFNYMAGYDWGGLVSLLYGDGFFWAMVYMCTCVMLYTSQIPALVRGLFYTSKMHKHQVLTAQNRSFCSFNPPQFCGKGSDQKKQEQLNSS
jgi:magnesium-transporting ATPase (P-type)